MDRSKRVKIMDASTPLDHRMCREIFPEEDSPIGTEGTGKQDSWSPGHFTEGQSPIVTSPTGNSRELDRVYLTPSRREENSSDFEEGANSLMDAAGKNDIIYQVVDESKDVNSLSRMVELCNLDSIDFSKWSQGSSFGSSGYDSTSYLNAISTDIFSVAIGGSLITVGDGMGSLHNEEFPVSAGGNLITENVGMNSLHSEELSATVRGSLITDNDCMNSLRNGELLDIAAGGKISGTDILSDITCGASNSGAATGVVVSELKTDGEQGIVTPKRLDVRKKLIFGEDLDAGVGEERGTPEAIQVKEGVY